MSLIIDGSGATASAAQPAGDVITSSDTSHFMADVIEASRQIPVIVDFWAPWCGPCKQLGPALEKLVRAAGGRVKLVKINVDENQQLAGQLRVQSIPTVFAFKDGQPVDAFQGALPESQLKQFIERLSAGAGSVIDNALEQADSLLEAGDAQGAAGIYNQVYMEDPENDRALGGLLRCLMAEGELEQARAFVDGLTPAMQGKGAIASAIAQLTLAEKGAEGGEDVAVLEAKLNANPADHQARIDLANALFGVGRKEAAVDALVESIRLDRSWNDEAARQQLVQFFEAMGHGDPITVAGRRKLSSILFS